MNVIVDASHCYMAGGKVRITIVSKLRNAAMHAAAKQVGSQAKLARRLGVKQEEISRWCNMKSCPPKVPRGEWSKERIDKLDSDLLEITGLLLDDIFPKTLRENTSFLRSPKVLEQTREVESEALLRLAENYAERIDVQPLRIAAQAELANDINDALERLSEREREVIERRFAINGKGTDTYGEIGHHLKITASRVQQIERKAIAKLQIMEGVLRSHMDDAVPSM